MSDPPSKTAWCPRENLDERRVLESSMWTTSPPSEKMHPSMADLLSVVKQAGYSDHKYLLRPLRKELSGEVLDIEIRSTALALEAARLTRVSHVLAVIYSPEEASRGERLAESEGLSNKIEFHTGDFLDVDIEGRYDWVVFNPPDFSPSLKILGPAGPVLELSMVRPLMAPVFLGKLDEYLEALLTKTTHLLKPGGKIFLKLLTYRFTTVTEGLNRKKLEDAFDVETLLEADLGGSVLYALSLDPRGSRRGASEDTRLSGQTGNEQNGWDLLGGV